MATRVNKIHNSFLQRNRFFGHQVAIQVVHWYKTFNFSLMILYKSYFLYVCIKYLLLSLQGSPFTMAIEGDRIEETTFGQPEFESIERIEMTKSRSVRSQPIAVALQKEHVFKTKERQWFLIQGGGEDIPTEDLDIVVRG